MIMLTGWVAFLLAWVSTAMFYKTHPSSVESGTEHKRFLYVFGKKKYLRGYKGERWERIISNGFIFSELSNKMKEEEEGGKEGNQLREKNFFAAAEVSVDKYLLMTKLSLFIGIQK